jgi:PAS domain S-box-containing protein
LSSANPTVHALIVEDSPTQANVLRHLLEASGFGVAVAENGQEALGAAKKRKPTFVISDVEMPIMGGYEMCHAIKQDPQLRDVPVILLTSLSEASDVLRGLEVGADYYLTKPYDPVQLLARVESILANPAPTGIGESTPAEVVFDGTTHVITADRRQILNLLLSTYAAAVQRNTELSRTKRELTLLNMELVDQARKLKQSEERHRAVVEQTAEGIYLVDADSRQVVESNAAFQKLLGYTAEELHDMSIYVFVGHDREDVDTRFNQVLTAGSHSFGEREYRRKDGSLVTVEASAGVITYGRRKALCTVVRDVTERKRVEAQLQEQNHLLEEAARSEREAHQTLKRAQAQMVQTEKLASLGQMVAGIAHEINNPLAFVSNNVAVLRRDVASVRDMLRLYRAADSVIKSHPGLFDPIAELSHRIDLDYTLDNLGEILVRSQDGLNRIRHIVTDLRDFARLDESDLSAVNINKGIESTVNIIRNRAVEKHVTIEMKLAEVPPLVCYPAKINQVILNLLGNAIDASTPGGIVGIQTVANGSDLTIEVSDSGCGIPPAILGRIFDPFFTTKPLGQGTGLGLSISYGIVTDHGGTIQVDSAPGRGSRFTIHLPLREMPEKEVAQA